MSSLLFENNDHSFDLNILHPKKSKPPSLEIEIHQLWSEFITKSAYSKYYSLSQRKFNSSLNTSKTRNASPSSTTPVPIIDKLTTFMHKHGIKILPDLTLGTITSYNANVLSETKLWIMYIILTLRAISSNEQQHEQSQKIFELFRCAVKKGCDVVEMFEFFLIVIAEMPLDVVVKCGEIIPKEFKEVYMKEREMLRKVFSEDERYVMVSEDYCGKGCFMLLKKVSDGSNEERFVIVPLKERFMYDDKKVVDELLKKLDESEYKNYDYMPYNSNIHYDNKK